jgi:hypothetical protein
LLVEQFGFIIAHPLRRGALSRADIKLLARKFDRVSDAEQFVEDVSNGIRCVLAYSPKIAAEVREGRLKRIAEADTFVKERQAPEKPY